MTVLIVLQNIVICLASAYPFVDRIVTEEKAPIWCLQAHTMQLFWTYFPKGEELSHTSLWIFDVNICGKCITINLHQYRSLRWSVCRFSKSFVVVSSGSGESKISHYHIAKIFGSVNYILTYCQGVYSCQVVQSSICLSCHSSTLRQSFLLNLCFH